MTLQRILPALCAAITMVALVVVLSAGSNPGGVVPAQAGGLPDFVVESINTLPISPQAGQSASVTVVIRNQGGDCVDTPERYCSYAIDIFKHSATQPVCLARMSRNSEPVIS